MSPPGERLERICAEVVASFANGPYLLTVTAEHRPHCGIAPVDWDLVDEQLVANVPSSWSGSEAPGHRDGACCGPRRNRAATA